MGAKAMGPIFNYKLPIEPDATPLRRMELDKSIEIVRIRTGEVKWEDPVLTQTQKNALENGDLEEIARTFGWEMNQTKALLKAVGVPERLLCDGGWANG